ncbi:MAG: TonB-dependent receptor domain-containing protein, partial [Bryobacteraceae bacterium]
KSTPAGIAFPQTVIDGSAYTNLGDTGGDFSTFLYHTLSSTVTRVSGNHSMRFGGDFRVLRENAYNFGNVAPRLEFAGAYTRGPLDNAAGAPIGQGLASMLFGIPSGGHSDINASRAQQSTFTSLYTQDDWKLSTRLTVNVGLRWEYEGPTTERFDRSVRGYDFGTANPIEERARANYALSPIAEVPVSAFRTPGGLTFSGAGGQPRGLWSADRNNFAPRVGLAYQWSPKTVVRAGYGIFYDLFGVDRQDVNQGGFNQSTNIIPTLDNGLSYRATLANPLPDGLEPPLGARGGARTFLGRAISFFDEHPLNPYMQRWSVTVQRELPGRTVTGVSYVGNRGTKILTTRQLSPIPEPYLSVSPVRNQPVIDSLSAQVNNPFFGIPEFTGTGLAAQRIARNQLLRAHPHFTGVTSNRSNGFSYYHSFQVEVEKRMGRGLSFLTSWTYSKFMEARTYLTESDLVPEKVISDQDYPHRLVVMTIYELPFGKGKAVLGNAGGLVDAIAGGWQLQGWFEGQTGQALGFGNAIFRGNLKDIPIPVSERRAERWFNTEAGFERAANLQLANNVVRFSSRFNGVRGDGINNWDFSMFKNFRLREGLNLQYRLETYNSLNHVQFGNPNTAPANTAFGTVTAEKGHGQRQVTMALKLLF